MRVLLVYPEFPDTFWSFRHALRFISKRASFPPLGLLTVAAMLPPAWEKRLVDMNVASLDEHDLAWADYVFVSAMAIQRRSVDEVLRRCRRAGVPVVAGGPLFTAEPEKYQAVDHLVLNEAELTLPRFLHDLAAGHPEQTYATSDFADVEQTPVPLWELVDLRRYAAMNIQYSRGCPFNCEFCNVTTLFGHVPRVKTAAQIIAELNSLHALGWRGNVFFVDDNLIGNKRRLRREVLPALKAWRARAKGISFQTEVSINLADDEELTREMVEAGFDTVFVGIETPNDESLAECGKSQNRRRDLAASVRRLQRAGLQVQGGFIVGFDADTPSIFQRQIDFIQRTGIVTAMVGLLQAPRGTPLYRRLAGEGRILDDPTGDNTDGSLNFVPRMNRDVLLAGYRRILQEIYAPHAYYERIRTFLKEYNPAHLGQRITWTEFVAFLRSIYRLGIRGAGRVHYWKLFFWTLLRRPRLFPVAITLSIYGAHFRRVAGLGAAG
ncbi:MAG: B12-binding domain-containing radical SAM protein [Anaerolineae bacterium]|nr:B12-binding domain-containing radical SAM protein [Anaerolineae bacterium]